MVFKFPYKLIIRDSGQLEFRKKKNVFPYVII